MTEVDVDLGGCGSSEPFALRVLGDSMEPEFPDGSIVVIDPGGVVEDGAYVIARHDGEYIFRRLRRSDGHWLLQAENPGYPRLPIEDINAVVGVVVQRAGTRRHQHKHYAGL